MCLFPLTTLLRQHNKGFIIADEIISYMLYLDDIKFYAKSKDDMVSLMNTVRIFFTDIRMDFGFEKCATLSMKIGNVAYCKGIELPTGIIRALPIGSCHKFLGALEAGGFQCEDTKCEDTKCKVKETYKQRLRLILKSKLNGKNQV